MASVYQLTGIEG